MDKLTKEILDRVRNVEGFPIGKDEEIIALSDPPCYTACPNPFIQEFIEREGKPYCEEEDHYHREPFAFDVSEGKNDPIYNAHSYHTKVPYKAIMRYILHYTDPGDIVFDGFCGTGMTGVAAQMCGNPDPEFKLQVEREMGSVKWGARKAVLCDLSPAATFIAYNYNTPVDVAEFEKEAKRILREVEKECGWMYQTMHVENGAVKTDLEGRPVMGRINYVVWSDVFVCPQCSSELVFWEVAVDRESGKVRDQFDCPHCRASLTKRNVDKAWETKYDKALKQTIRQVKQVPVLINYSVGRKRYEKKPDRYDLELLKKIEEMDIPYWYPTDRMPEGYNTEQPKKSHGITHVHHFYTRRNLYILAFLFEKIRSVNNCNVRKNLYFILTGMLTRSSKQARFLAKNYFFGGGGYVGTSLSGTLFIASLSIEVSVLHSFRNRIKKITKNIAYYFKKDLIRITTQSSEKVIIEGNTIDYIFTDPPFGSNLMYSELNFLWEAWLRVFTNKKPEAIVNKVQKKGIFEYQELMERCFKEMYRILKPGRWLTMVFHNSQNSVWNAIQEALMKAGFVVADVRVLDKKQGSFKQVTTTSAIKKDLVVSAYKPRTEFMERFLKEAGTEKGVWEFIRQHLANLPVAVVKNGYIEVVAERQKYALYDKMVAFHIQNGVSIPMGAAEFYRELHQRFPERDGMYFLPDQLPEYDRKRIKVNSVEQLSFLISDEKSAIQWLTSKLGEKPMTYQEIQPQFMREARFSRYEKKLELVELLEQNFLKNECGEWYVPDPDKQEDLEKMREKALLKEFEGYKQGKGRLKVFRREAVRAGFKHCWDQKGYGTIVKIAERIPDTIIQEDPDLFMLYKAAKTLLEGR